MPELPASGVPFDRTRLTRRGFMAIGIAGGLTLAACSQSKSQVTGSAARMTAAIAAAEAARPHSDGDPDPTAGPDRSGWTNRAYAGLRQYHSRTRDQGQHR